MAIYRNQSADAAIREMEINPGPNGYLTVYHLNSAQAREGMEQWLGATKQTVLAHSESNGRPLLITQSKRTPEQQLHALSAQGDQFQLVRESKPIDPWVIRSLLGFSGQGLTLVSSFMRPPKPNEIGKSIWQRLDWSVFVFAAANLAANTINLVYRAQDIDDTHQLKYLKTQVNDQLNSELMSGQEAPSPDDKRLAQRPVEKKPANPLHAFMQRYSVNVGELGLRYIGAIGMAYPANGWKAIGQGKLPPMSEVGLRRFAGFGSLAGKTLALSSKVPDPYNPAPHSWLDTIREKYSFVSGGIIEAIAFAGLAWDSFMNTGPGKRESSGIAWNGKNHRDWLGGIGAVLFVAGYIVRSWAKYGKRSVDMNELYAHATDTLAKVSPEKMPQLLADTARQLKEHFKDRPDIHYGVIYSRLAEDLHQHHHIDLEPQGATTHLPTPVVDTPSPKQPQNRVGLPLQADRVSTLEKQAVTAL